jgi:hypothetical protein
VGDIFGWVRFQDYEIGEISLFDLADVRAGLAAEQLSGVRGRALQNLHRRQSGFFHQLKLAEQRRAVNGADVPRIGAGRLDPTGTPLSLRLATLSILSPLTTTTAFSIVLPSAGLITVPPTSDVF